MKKTAKKKKVPRSWFWRFLSESRAALFLIGINSAVFGYLSTHAVGKDQLMAWVLYPGNLLEGRYWCLVTSGFLHRDWTHLALNMLGVFVFGRVVERHLGVARTLMIYFGALVISMMFSTAVYAFVFSKSVAIIGASGAVMGLLGAAMLLEPFAVTWEMFLPLPVMVKGWLFLLADLKGFLGGERDGVSHLAHLTGFLSVAFLVYLLSRKDQKKMRAGLIINICSFIAFWLARVWMIQHNVFKFG